MAGSPKLPPADDAFVRPLCFDYPKPSAQNSGSRSPSPERSSTPQVLTQLERAAARDPTRLGAYPQRTGISARAPHASLQRAENAEQTSPEFAESQPAEHQSPFVKNGDAMLPDPLPASTITEPAALTGLPRPPLVSVRPRDDENAWAPKLKDGMASAFTSSRRLVANTNVKALIDPMRTDQTDASLYIEPNSLHNLTPGQLKLQRRLLTKPSIDIVVCGSGYTALSTIAHTLLDATGGNRSTLHPAVPYPRKIRIKLISPDGIGGLAYTPGAGALDDPASTTNTPASHLEIQILGLQFKDYFDYRIKNAKSIDESNYFANLKKENYDSDTEKPDPGLRLDTLYHRYSSKNKTNTRSTWEGQVQRGNDGVLGYMKWVKERLAKINNVVIEEVEGTVDSYETKDGQPVFKYRDKDDKPIEIAGDVAIMAGGQGPLKEAPKQMNSLDETQKLSWDEIIKDADKALTAIKTGTVSEAAAAMEAFSQKYLNRRLLIIGTGIAAEEIQPAMDAVVKAYEKRRSASDSELKPLPKQNGTVTYISRNGYIHELSQAERGALRYAHLENEFGKATFTKIATRGELEYREKLIKIFHKDSTANASQEFGQLLTDMKGDPVSRFQLVQALTRLARDISSGRPSKYDDHVDADPFIPRREDIDECMLRINRDHNSAIETVAVPTRNENVVRFKNERAEGRLYAVGNDYKFVTGKDGTFMLQFDRKQRGPFDAALNATGRNNYGVDASSVAMPNDTHKVGSATDKSLQSYDVDPGFWLANSKGGIHPLVVLTPALIQREVMMGSRSIEGAPGAVAAFGVSAKVSGLRTNEAGEIFARMVYPAQGDALDSLSLIASRLPG